MYQSYWNLNRKPFSQHRAVESLYSSQSHRSALRRLKYCIDNYCGAAVLVGPSGTGKSVLLKSLEASDDRLRPTLHLIFPSLSVTETLRLIACELGQETALQEPEQPQDDRLLRLIQRTLLTHCQVQQHPLICFDDAHQLSDQVLQSVVLPLLNLSTMDEGMRLSVILAGNPVLLSRLRRHAQLSDRIGVVAPLQGFSPDECSDYVRTSIAQAGGDSSIFTPAALTRLHEVTGGNPRRINRLCDMALLVGMAEQLKRIDASEIAAVTHELISAAA